MRGRRGRFAAPAATHFANSGKVGKAPFKGEMFRFISPLKIPLFTDQSRPRKLQITRLARKGKTRSFRYSSSPNGNRLCWISIGLPFRHPYWMYPPGTGDGEETTQGGNCTIRHPPHHGGAPGEARLSG